MLADIRDPDRRAAVAEVLDRFEAVVVPALADCCAPSASTRTSPSTTPSSTTTAGSPGIVDFGDMSYSALAVDIASVIDSLANGRDGDELFRVSRLVIDGYQRVTPLEPIELRLMGELHRGALRGDDRDPGLARGPRPGGRRVRRALHGLGRGDRPDDPRHRLGRGRPGGSVRPGGRPTSASLAARREAVLGPALEPLTYEHPIHMASARGVWMTDVDGRRYLDAYNNVPCVGHSHPRVAEATARQARLLNTNMRYLHASAIELAERLVATCPPGLDTVLFVNSGSEANDLAWRMATTWTGNHGWPVHDPRLPRHLGGERRPVPGELGGPDRPANIETWAPPDTYRGTNGDTAGFAAAIERLAARGIAPAATILDGVLTSDGFYDLDPAYVAELVRLTRAAGGLWIADEVQGGHGRTGSSCGRSSASGSCRTS